MITANARYFTSKIKLKYHKQYLSGWYFRFKSEQQLGVEPFYLIDPFRCKEIAFQNRHELIGQISLASEIDNVIQKNLQIQARHSKD